MFKLIFKLAGWRITHYLPAHIKQCVIVVAPHTSNWDFVYGMAALKFMKLPARFAIKKEWIRFPFKRLMLRLGALPIDRGAKQEGADKKGTVDAMAELFEKHPELKLVITPEGTRKKVTKWKTGFYYVALKANVPICLAFIDSKTKTCGIDKILYPSGDFHKDMKIIMEFYQQMTGINPENFSVDLELLNH